MKSSMIYPKVHLNVLVAALIVFLPGLGVITLWPGHSIKARLHSLMWSLCFYGFNPYEHIGDYMIYNIVISSITLFFVICGWLLVLYKHQSNTGKRYDHRDLSNDEYVTTTYFFWWF
jgi:hypothetical protein